MWCFSVDFVASGNVTDVLPLPIRMAFAFDTIGTCAGDALQPRFRDALVVDVDVHIHRCLGDRSRVGDRRLLYVLRLRFLFDMLHRLRCYCDRLRHLGLLGPCNSRCDGCTFARETVNKSLSPILLILILRFFIPASKMIPRVSWGFCCCSSRMGVMTPRFV